MIAGVHGLNRFDEPRECVRSEMLPEFGQNGREWSETVRGEGRGRGRMIQRANSGEQVCSI